jgi:hypothetical protein
MTKLVDRIAIAITSGAKLAIAEMWATGTITERTNIPTNRATVTSATAMTRMQVRTLVAVRALTARNQSPIPAIDITDTSPTAIAIMTPVMCSRAT